MTSFYINSQIVLLKYSEIKKLTINNEKKDTILKVFAVLFIKIVGKFPGLYSGKLGSQSR
jgi:hypothetical protein